MEATIVYALGYILGLYRDNGQENGKYYSTIYLISMFCLASNVAQLGGRALIV